MKQSLHLPGSPKDEPRSTKRETENLTYDFNEIIPEPESYLTKDINPLSGDHEASSGNVHQEKFSSESIRESEDMIHPKDTCVLEELSRKDICETRKCKDNSNPNEGDSEQWTESVENTKKQTIEASQCNINSDSGEDMVHDPLSFFDLLRLVERGEPIPGVAELCVEPTNDEPTPPTASRIRKPWESWYIYARATVTCTSPSGSGYRFCFAKKVFP